jgi:hypothetical protein
MSLKVKLAAPVASDPTERVADWLEIEALRSPEKNISLESLIQVIRRAGSVDAIADPSNDQGLDSRDTGSVLSQSVAQDSFVEIENRKVACGDSRYPFVIEQGLLRLKSDSTNSAYVLLLLMSATAPTAGHNGTAVLFERLCQEAALGYLGGTTNGANALRFGAPRRRPVAKLSQALDDLCAKLIEGGGCKYPDKARHTGDEGLDVVAWRSFPDSKIGKLIAFGQCAGGEGNWPEKLAELDARRFTQKWFREVFVVDPVRLFFVPRRIPRIEWEHAGIDGGILFDRCRIVACLSDVNAKLARDCRQVTRKLLRATTKGVRQN